jgi:hypothetical protein
MSLAVAVRIDDCKEANTFYLRIQEGIRNFGSYPFVSSICFKWTHEPDQKVRVILSFDEFFFYPLWWVGLPFGLIMWYFQGFTPWLLIPIALSAIDYFRSNLFMYHLFKIALWKSHYKGKIERLQLASLIKELP